MCVVLVLESLFGKGWIVKLITSNQSNQRPATLPLVNGNVIVANFMVNCNMVVVMFMLNDNVVVANFMVNGNVESVIDFVCVYYYLIVFKDFFFKIS